MKSLGEIWREAMISNSGLDEPVRDYYARTGDGYVDERGQWHIGQDFYDSPEYPYDTDWIRANGGCMPSVRGADHEATYTCDGRYVEAKGKARKVKAQKEQAQLPVVQSKRPRTERREEKEITRREQFTQPSRRHETVRKIIQDVPPLTQPKVIPASGFWNKLIGKRTEYK